MGKEIEMKTRNVLVAVLLIALVALLLCGCGKKDQDATSSPEDPNAAIEATDGGQPTQTAMIEPGVGVGQVRIGMTVEEMKESLDKPDIDATGISYAYADHGFEVIFRDGQVHSINCVHHINNAPAIKPCPYKTAEGIGIGSTESKVLAAYGEPDKRTRVGWAYKSGVRFEFTDGEVSLMGVLKPW